MTMCCMICSFSWMFCGGGGRSEISNLDPAIMSECWFVMHSVVMMSFKCDDSGEECPMISPTILCESGLDDLVFVGSWNR